MGADEGKEKRKGERAREASQKELAESGSQPTLHPALLNRCQKPKLPKLPNVARCYSTWRHFQEMKVLFSIVHLLKEPRLNLALD